MTRAEIARNVLFGVLVEIPIVALNAITWRLVRCEWSHPYGGSR